MDYGVTNRENKNITEIEPETRNKQIKKKKKKKEEQGRPGAARTSPVAPPG